MMGNPEIYHPEEEQTTGAVEGQFISPEAAAASAKMGALSPSTKEGLEAPLLQELNETGKKTLKQHQEDARVQENVAARQAEQGEKLQEIRQKIAGL